MTLIFDGELLERHVDNDLAMRAMRDCFDTEAAGKTNLQPRIDTSTGKGFIRVMPALFDDVMGLKVMTLVNGLGNRYLVLLYAVATGELLAMFDADELTRIRTAATTALAGLAMVDRPPDELGMIGTGFEAVGHLRMLAHVWPLARVRVYSPTEANRRRFAEAMSSELGIAVTPSASAADAVRDQPVVVLATKAKVPVVDGRSLAPGTVVLSIGSTRLDLRELDDECFRRASVVIADHVDQIQEESADIAEAIASGILQTDRIVALSRLRGDPSSGKRSGGDLRLFKSVGTALQDLALARLLFRDENFRKAGNNVGEITRLKPFSAKVFDHLVTSGD